MFHIFLRIYFVAILVTIAFVAVRSCSDSRSKTSHEYHGVDPSTQPIVDEYLRLSAENNITFNNTVTVGLKVINHDYAVGICNYGKNWREIDVDKELWDGATNATKYALLFHELTHCYCGRDHDFGKDKPYKDVEELRKENSDGVAHEGGGFYPDNCPTSLMYPMVVDDGCMNTHYQEYKKEMFDRCEPF